MGNLVAQPAEGPSGFHALTSLPPPECVADILAFLSWTDRRHIALVHPLLAGYCRDPAHWRWMCLRLGLEEYVYVPMLLPLEVQWREHFQRAFTMVPRWRSISDPRAKVAAGAEGAAAGADDEDAASALAADSTAKELFHAHVVARLRPLSTTATDSPAPDVIIIPLHQRLQMLRAQYQCTASEALRLLWEPHTRGQPGREFDPWAHAVLADGEPSDNARDNKTAAIAHKATAASVAVDVGARAPAGVVSVSPTSLIMTLPSVGLRQFRFGRVFESTATQASVFAHTAEPLVQDFMNGSNCTLFSYGQTGSGKTHTMFGPSGTPRASLTVQASTGLVGRTCARVVAAVRTRRALGLTCELAVSYIEVFGDNVHNLIEASEAVGTWHGVAARVVVQGRVSVPVVTEADIETVLEAGERFKRTAATAMNEHSSRAHSLLFLHLKQTHPRSHQSVSSQLCMADLGGSEQVAQSHVTGVRLAEAIHINQGLFALKSCVLALVRNDAHVPFQQSRLTSLLQSALSGRARMVVVVTGSLAPAHAAQTAQALLFGEQCQRIEGHAQAGATVSEEAIAAINASLARLEGQIQQTETWVTQKTVRIDPVDGREEILLTTVPSGADHLRREYEVLLQTRRFLLGEQPISAATADHAV